MIIEICGNGLHFFGVAETDAYTMHYNKEYHILINMSYFKEIYMFSDQFKQYHTSFRILSDLIPEFLMVQVFGYKSNKFFCET